MATGRPRQLMRPAAAHVVRKSRQIDLTFSMPRCYGTSVRETELGIAAGLVHVLWPVHGRDFRRLRWQVS